MIDVSSILWFLALYFLLTLVQILIGAIDNLSDLIVALIVAKINKISEEINSEDESKDVSNCIGFQITSKEEDEDINDD